ncbi:MAG: hypothetical protein ABIR30_09135 [Chitinophagaceae bacterium]
MGKIFFLLLGWPLFTAAQKNEYDIAFAKSIPPGLGKPVRLPEREYNSNFSIVDLVDYDKRERVFIIKEDSVYRALFWRYVYTEDSLKKYRKTNDNKYFFSWMEKHMSDSLPQIDFSKKELVLYSACAQCLAYCEHDEKNGYNSCHRNVCMFRDAWFIREKKTSYVKE